MWNSNSLTSWLLARTGHDMTTIRPPNGGRAPGWHAGLVLVSRHGTATPAQRALWPYRQHLKPSILELEPSSTMAVSLRENL